MAEIATWYCRRCFEPFGPGTVICPQHQLKLVEVKDPGTSIVGQLVDGKYKVESVLGVGGMGTVFRARQMPIEREVALKILNLSLIRDKTGVKRFIQEAQAASMLKSRYSAMIYDFGLSYEGYLYFTMELVGGRLLSEVLVEEKRLPVERVLHVAIDVCRSLEEAHLRGIIHRDIKPGNIMLSELDGHEIAKVLDFGTAELMTWKKTSKLTDLGKVHGTAEYMSPEQAQAKPVTVGTDLYSLGITIYEMLAGEPPFTGPAAIPVLLSHVNDTPRPVAEIAPDAEIPTELNNLVSRLLQKDPAARFDSAQELRYRLEDILGEVGGPLSGGALRLHLGRPDLKPRRRNIVIFDTSVQRHGSRRVDEISEHAPPARPIQQTMTLDPKQLWREAGARTPEPLGIMAPGTAVQGSTTSERDRITSREQPVDTAPRMGGQDTAPRMGGQDTAPRMGGQDTAPRMGGQDTAPRMGGQDTAPRMGGQDTAARRRAEAAGKEEAVRSQKMDGPADSPREGESPAATSVPPASSAGAGPARTIIESADAIEHKTPTVPDMPSVRKRPSRALIASVVATLLGAGVGGAGVLLYPELLGFSTQDSKETAPPPQETGPAAVPLGQVGPVPAAATSGPATSTVISGTPEAAAPDVQGAAGADVGAHPGDKVDAVEPALAAGPASGDIVVQPPPETGGSDSAQAGTGVQEGADATTAAGVEGEKPPVDAAGATTPADTGKKAPVDAAGATTPADTGKKAPVDAAGATTPADTGKKAPVDAAGAAAADSKKSSVGAGEKKKEPHADRHPHGKEKVPGVKTQGGKETIKFSEEDLQ